MIYSKWKPAKGGYDYYQAAERDVPLGNDLPAPVMPAGTAIGVASIDVGRPIPPGARKVGSGQEAVGLIAPTERSAFGAVTSLVPKGWALVAAGIVGGWYLTKKKVI